MSFLPILQRDLLTVTGGFDLSEERFDSYLGAAEILVIGEGQSFRSKKTSSTVEQEVFNAMRSKKQPRKFEPQICKKKYTLLEDHPIKKLSQRGNDEMLLSCPSGDMHTILSQDPRRQRLDDFEVAERIDDIVGRGEDTSDDSSQDWAEESRLAIADINSAIKHISHHPNLTGDIAEALKTTTEILSDVTHEVFARIDDFSIGDAMV